jgi:hypothetical protein
MLCWEVEEEKMDRMGGLLESLQREEEKCGMHLWDGLVGDSG